MKVLDFDLDFSSGLFTCCMDHILGNEDEVEVGDTIECDHCGATLVLQEKNGTLMWRKRK